MCNTIVQALQSQQNDTGTSIKEEMVHVASKEVVASPLIKIEVMRQRMWSI
jgi:hypothetical protein